MKDCLVKNILDSFPGERGTFDVSRSLQTLGEYLSFLFADWLLLVLVQLVQGCPVDPQVNLSSQQEKRSVWAVMLDFWNPHFLYISEGGGFSHGEAEEEDGGTNVGDRSQSLVILAPTFGS